MSQNETTEEVDDVAEDTANVEGEGVETSSDDEEITYADYYKQKEELEKARKKIAILSKEKKTIEKPKEDSKETSKELDEDTLDELLDKRDFYKKNPTAKELRSDIEELYKASKGKFSREKLLADLTGDSEVEENRKVYAKSSVTGKQGGTESFTAVDIDRYDRMSTSEQKAYNEASKAKFGGVKFKE